MEVKFYNIEERDTDFSIIKSFIENDKVRDLFFNQIGINGSITKIYHSYMDRENNGHMGESDIIIICENDKERFAIFIEDKIAADPQPSQSERYIDRAEALKEKEKYDSYFIFLCAPEAYLDTEKASGYTYTVSHEQIAELLDDNSFDKAVFTFSTDEKKQGYTPIRDDDVTDFWEQLYSHVKRYYPMLCLPTVKGSRGKSASWPAFKTNVKGLVIRWKTDRNYIDLEFSNMAETNDRKKMVCNLLSPLKDNDYIIEETGKSLSLRKSISIDEEVSFHKSFNKQINRINKCLDYISDFMKLANDIYYKGSYCFPPKKLEEEYLDKFGDLPPLNMTMSYSHPVYQYLMKKALNENKEISMNDLDNEIDKRHIKYDMDYD